MKYHSSQRNPISFRVSYHSSSIHILSGVSLALFQQGNDGRMAVLGRSFSIFPHSLQGAILDPADLDRSCLAAGGVAVHFDSGQVLHDGFLEAVCRAAVSSRATVLNINFVGHIKLLIYNSPFNGL
jgi:hypothetical protein